MFEVKLTSNMENRGNKENISTEINVEGETMYRSCFVAKIYICTSLVIAIDFKQTIIRLYILQWSWRIVDVHASVQLHCSSFIQTKYTSGPIFFHQVYDGI